MDEEGARALTVLKKTGAEFRDRSARVMSLKYAAQMVGDGHYVLPKVGSMKVEAHAFFSENLYEASDEGMWKQIMDGASYEGVIGAYLMPDAHQGFGVPVGSVIVTEDTLIQAGSGYDISCGVVFVRVPGLMAEGIADKEKRRRWIDEVEKRVAAGVGAKRPAGGKKFSLARANEILRHGVKPLGVSADVCERQFIPVADDVELGTIEKANANMVEQIGSVGGGNHFIEMQCDAEDGEVWVMVHCGSRGYGWQVANHFFYRGAEVRGLPANRREESWLRIDESLGKEYWAYHNSAANYAIANRHVIVAGVQEALAEVFNAEGTVYYEISHNLVQEETIFLPDGTSKKGFVHRKGATRAFPAGHPDLVGTKWNETGHPCLVPGSMFSGAAILFPNEGAYKSGCSVNHGSGRQMARGVAKRGLKDRQGEIDEEMKSVKRVLGGVTVEGIVGNAEHTPLDECAHVYKDLDAVIEVLVANDIARVEHRLFPVANIKGAD